MKRSVDWFFKFYLIQYCNTCKRSTYTIPQRHVPGYFFHCTACTAYSNVMYQHLFNLSLWPGPWPTKNEELCTHKKWTTILLCKREAPRSTTFTPHFLHLSGKILNFFFNNTNINVIDKINPASKSANTVGKA